MATATRGRTTPLRRLLTEGQSLWYDNIRRQLITSGELARMRDEGVRGVTSNPTIFQKALSGSSEYDEKIVELAKRRRPVESAMWEVLVEDIQAAADVFRPVYDESGGADGFVSLEVSPNAANDTRSSVRIARKLWRQADRPNVMIKIPAMSEGMAAITAATAAGISVNVTLIFGLDRYDQVMDAYLTGLEGAKAAGIDLSTIRSVASFFVSRVDTEVDKRLDKIGTDAAKALRGKAGIANARLAYERYEKVLASDRWKALEATGANRQRPLWASTGVKDPAYDDTMYVVELAVADTVNTMPEATLDAVTDHAKFHGDAVHGSYDDSRAVIDGLNELGIGYNDVIEVLENEGVQKFEDSYAQLADSVETQLDAVSKSS